jgi:uncharacterized membrane protein YeaQ/YmgE (transglycosylase-associated protein family)
MLLSFILFILVGAAAGYIAGLIMKGGGFGFWINLLLGILGGFLGGWIFHALGIPGFELIGGLLSAIVGAVILIWIASLFTKKKK